MKVVPGSSRDRLAGLLGDALKVQVAAAAERGKANAAVEALLAETLGISARGVSVIRGHSSPRKTVLARGVTLEQAVALLTPAGPS